MRKAVAALTLAAVTSTALLTHTSDAAAQSAHGAQAGHHDALGVGRPRKPWLRVEHQASAAARAPPARAGCGWAQGTERNTTRIASSPSAGIITPCSR